MLVNIEILKIENVSTCWMCVHTVIPYSEEHRIDISGKSMKACKQHLQCSKIVRSDAVVYVSCMVHVCIHRYACAQVFTSRSV
jgi:hypothetical protein